MVILLAIEDVGPARSFSGDEEDGFIASARKLWQRGSFYQHIAPIVHPHSSAEVEDLFLRSWGRTPFRFKPGQQRLGWLFDWEDLNNALSSHNLQDWQVRASIVLEDGQDKGTSLAVGTGRLETKGICPVQVQEAVESGHTIAVNSVQRINARVAKLCDRLSRLFATHVTVNIYLSVGEDRGFPTHADTHDVLILQLDGEKRWECWEPTVQWPDRHHISHENVPEGDAKWNLVLEKGEAFHVPHGWWHRVTPLGKESLHATVTIPRPSLREAVSWLAGHCAEWRIRRPVGTEEVDWQSEIAEALASECANGRDAIGRFLAYRCANLKGSANFAYPLGLRDGAGCMSRPLQIELAVPGFVLPNESVEQRSFWFECVGRRWRVDRSLAGTMAELLQGVTMEIDGTADRKRGEIGDDCLRQLVKSGLVRSSL